MKKNLIHAVGIGWILLAAGCCSIQTPAVSVREAIHRSELASTNRIVLPLTPQSREFVLQFLRSGRNPVLEGDATISNPGAEQEYAGLLNLLGNGSLAVSNLVADQKFNATAAFKPWFPSPAVRQVIDAREEYVPAVQPYAFLDTQGRHWWVFYHRQKRLTHVLITRTSPAAKER